MALESTIAAVNVSNSRDISLTPPSPEKNAIGKSTYYKTCQKSASKNSSSLLTATNKQIANQAFYNVLIQLVSDSQLLDKVAYLE